MLKYLFIFLSSLLLTSLALAQNPNDFEAELQLLESNQLEANKDFSEMVEDSVTEGMASPKKPAESPKADESKSTKKTRRVPSR